MLGLVQSSVLGETPPVPGTALSIQPPPGTEQGGLVSAVKSRARETTPSLMSDQGKESIIRPSAHVSL